jgi:hypothetical protein
MRASAGVNERLPLVRLSRDERWAVCARSECGERFAKRIEIPIEMQLRQIVPPGLRPREAVLDFIAGWVRNGDTWSMSKRARVRLSQGRQPAFRRNPATKSDEDASSEIGLESSSGRDRTWRPEVFSENDHGVPCYVICPACGTRQLADPVVLRCQSDEDVVDP